MSRLWLPGRNRCEFCREEWDEGLLESADGKKACPLCAQKILSQLGWNRAARRRYGKGKKR